MAFLCLLRKVIGPAMSMSTTEGSLTGCVERRSEVQWPRSKGRRPVDFDLGGSAQSSSRRHTVGGRARSSASVQEGEAGNDALPKEVTEADKLAKDGTMMDGGEIRASTVQKKKRRFTRGCNVQPAFIVWWRKGKAAKSSNQSQKKSWTVVAKNGEADNHRVEWSAAACECGRSSKAESVGENAIGRTRGGEESGPKWRGLGVVLKVFGLCGVVCDRS